jgi:hypothetical protein
MATFSKVVGSVVGNLECSKELLVDSFREAITTFVRANNSTGIKDAVIATGKTAKGKTILTAIQAVTSTLKVGYLAPKGIRFDDQPAEDLIFWNTAIDSAVTTFTSGIESLGLKTTITEEVKAERKVKADKVKAEKLESEIKARGLVDPNTVRILTIPEMVNQTIDALLLGDVTDSQLFDLTSAIDACKGIHKAVAAALAKRHALQDADKLANIAHAANMLIIEASGMGEDAEKARELLRTGYEVHNLEDAANLPSLAEERITEECEYSAVE